MFHPARGAVSQPPQQGDTLKPTWQMKVGKEFADGHGGMVG
ncbi:MAG: hypothetical protein ACPG6P_01215 [Akkermansiaceae bacterium]